MLSAPRTAHVSLMKTVVLLHQTAELYGSDRALLSLAARLDRALAVPVVVVPREGPLADALRHAGVEVRILPIGHLSRSSMTLRGLPRLLWRVPYSSYCLARDFGRVDLVHSNTLAVLGAILWCRWMRITHVWHVHEIVHRPLFGRRILGWLLERFADRIVFNSEASRQSMLDVRPSLARKSVVVRNGVATPAESGSSLREEIGVGADEVVIALVGRISSWKGQSLLVEAAETLHDRGITARYWIAGTPSPGQEHFQEALESRLAESAVGRRFTVLGFCEDVWKIWNACDIAVVPSTEPEPFGLVAVEAMLAGKPVVGAAHGGLMEIVVDGRTGRLFEPSCADSLAEALEELISDPQRRRRMGSEGAERARSEFSEDRYVGAIEALYRELL